jgi:hypothetical protein
MSLKAAVTRELEAYKALSNRIKGYARGWNLPFMERLMGSTAIRLALASKETV